MNILKTKKLHYLVLFLFLFTTLTIQPSCRTTNISKSEKRLQKEKKKRAKEDVVLYEKAVKRHMKGQTKETQQQMKENNKTAEQYNDRKKDNFIKRFFKERANKNLRKQKG
jgi:pyruvate/2-oxoacid:ferredoxin oxidoreductase beta subunit